MDNRYSKYKKTIAARGGIKLQKSKAKREKLNWWSRRWLDFIETSIDAKRLGRGKTYARKGQVISLEIEAGAVSALVQGSRETPYRVRLAFETLTDDGRRLLLFKLKERALFGAALLAGTMPKEMEELFTECGTRLFPALASVKRFACGCPDGALICKHIVAVLLLLAEVLDDDPFLILKLRGLEKDQLIDSLVAGTNESEYSETDFDEENLCGDFERGEDPSISGGSEIALLKEESENEKIYFDAAWFSSKLKKISCAPDERAENRGSKVEKDFPFWRGEETFRESLAVFYEKGAALALEILTGEKIAKVGRPRKY